MAIVNNGTKVQLAVIPAGYSRPAVTEISDFEYKRDVSLNVLKSTVEDADETITLANIINNATIGITKQVTDILAADYLGTATVTAYAILKKISTNAHLPVGTGNFYTNAGLNYICEVTILVKAA